MRFGQTQFERFALLGDRITENYNEFLRTKKAFQWPTKRDKAPAEMVVIPTPNVEGSKSLVENASLQETF